MGRVKIKFPEDKTLFAVQIPVRITDINYGGHLGNDALLSIIQEARMQLLATKGFTELETGGHGLIMADVMIAYKGEAFYGDILEVAVAAEDLTDRSFDLIYRVTTQRGGQRAEIAVAKTGMVCFDYETRRIVTMSALLKSLLTGMEF